MSGWVRQDVQRLQQQVAEVGRVQRLQPFLVLADRAACPCRRHKPWASPSLTSSGRRPRFFQPSIMRRQRAGRPALFVHAFGLDQLLHQAQLVVGIQDGEVGFQPRQLGMAAQHLGADGVEGAQPLHAFDHAADQGADALLHLARGLVGEGDAQHLARPGALAWPGCAPAGWSARGSCRCRRRPAPARGHRRLPPPRAVRVFRPAR